MSLTKIESDFKFIIPLKSPAYVGLYLTMILDSSIGEIFKTFGSTERRAPWPCEN